MPLRAQRTRIGRACACLCLSLGVARGSHVEAAPPEASSSLLRGSAGASRYGPLHAEPLADLGFERFTLEHGGNLREFHVYVPGRVTREEPAEGLVMFFHGFSLSAEHMCGGGHQADTFAAKPQADEQGFIAVCPQGLGSDASDPKDRGWNCEACCGYPFEQGIDDVGFVAAMLGKLESTILPKKGLAYPTRNVFAFGFSNGGLFSYRLACELQDKIHGVAPSGAAFDHAFKKEGDPVTIKWASACTTSVPVWASLGTSNATTSVKQGVEGFVKYAKKLNCKPSSCVPTAPAAGVECLKFKQCPTHAKARLCVYGGAKHAVRPLREQFDHGHVKEAWKFLTQGVHRDDGKPTALKILAGLGSFFSPRRAGELIEHGCPESAE